MDDLAARYIKEVSARLKHYVGLRGPSNPSVEIEPAQAVAAHELFECYLFYQAAKDSKFYDMSKLERRFEAFFLSLREEGSVKRHEYVDHSALSADLATDFAEFRWILEVRLTGGRPDRPVLSLRLPELRRSDFSRFLSLHLAMMQQPSLRVFAEAVKYASGEKWSRLMEYRPSPQEATLAGDESELTTAGVYHGFLCLLGTIAAVNEATPDLASSEESADAASLLSFVRTVINWRLDLKSYEFNKRVDLLRNYILDDATEGLTLSDRRKLKEQLEEVIYQVLGFVPA